MPSSVLIKILYERTSDILKGYKSFIELLQIITN